MLTKQEMDKFFETFKIIEDAAPKIAEEAELIRNSVFGYTFFITAKGKHPYVNIDLEEGVSVEYALNSDNASFSVPLYAFIESSWQWQLEYRREQELEFETKAEKKRQKNLVIEENRRKTRRHLYEELKKEFEETSHV